MSSAEVMAKTVGVGHPDAYRELFFSRTHALTQSRSGSPGFCCSSWLPPLFHSWPFGGRAAKGATQNAQHGAKVSGSS